MLVDKLLRIGGGGGGKSVESSTGIENTPPKPSFGDYLSDWTWLVHVGWAL